MPDLLSVANTAGTFNVPARAPEQARAARRGYVLAEAAMGSDADEAAWRAASNADDQATIDRLNAEGEARRQRADEIGKQEGWW